jgi:phospholipid/cholesterol/gamma-HCH transport system substrate-binding protein
LKKFYPDLHRTQVKVGAFTVIILLILVFGYLWLSGRISTQAQQDMRLSFTDVMGLEIGDKAMFRGMEVGRIKAIEARNDDILVTARINRDIRVREGARFYIADSSLMGGTALNIAQGGGDRFLDLNKVQPGESPQGIMSVLARASDAIDEVKAFLADIRGDGGLLRRSEGLLDDAGSAVRTVDGLAGSMNSELSSTIRRIDSLTAQLNRMVELNGGKAGQLLDSAPRTIANINSTLDSLQLLSGRLNRTVEAVNKGKGTAGRLVGEDELYRRLLESVAHLDSLVKDIKAHPKKYVKFSLF